MDERFDLGSRAVLAIRRRWYILDDSHDGATVGRYPHTETVLRIDLRKLTRGNDSTVFLSQDIPISPFEAFDLIGAVAG